MHARYYPPFTVEFYRQRYLSHFLSPKITPPKQGEGRSTGNLKVQSAADISPFQDMRSAALRRYYLLRVFHRLPFNCTTGAVGRTRCANPGAMRRTLSKEFVLLTAPVVQLAACAATRLLALVDLDPFFFGFKHGCKSSKSPIGEMLSCLRALSIVENITSVNNLLQLFFQHA